MVENLKAIFGNTYYERMNFDWNFNVPSDTTDKIQQSPVGTTTFTESMFVKI